ncbi:hypothetical protein EDB65_102270 [Vibrio crassostreae]|nr:hypothetical protein EDB65_102270 [Vibrio crassostreae]
MIFSLNCAFAISISSLLEVANDDDSAIIRVVNNDEVTMFVKVTSNKLQYNNGVRETIELSKNNVGSWGLKYTPTHLVLEPGEEKSVKLWYKCDLEPCDRSKDIVYGVNFSPTPYLTSDQDKMNLVLGYKTYFVLTADKPKYAYALEKSIDNKVMITNKGNSSLMAIINNCTSDIKSNCIFKYRLLPEVSKFIELPKPIFTNEIKFFTLHDVYLGIEYI